MRPWLRVGQQDSANTLFALSLQYAEQGLVHTGILLLIRSLPPNNFTGIAHALVHYAREQMEDVYHHTDWSHPAPTDED